jgi:5'-3' exonuclease
MASLCERLSAWSQKSTQKDIKVQISDAAKAGEGEHKIFRRINSDSSYETVAIYGADADLILLSLISRAQRPFVYRQTSGRPLEIVDIEVLRKRIGKTMGIDEFVVLCTFLGNDFLPPFSYIRAREQGVDALVRLHQTLQLTLLKDSKELDWAEIRRLVQAVASHEDEAMAHLDATLATSCKFKFNKPKDPKSRSAMSSMIQVGSPGWRDRYYQGLFPNFVERFTLHEIVQDYLDGIRWTHEYYFKYDSSAARTSDWHYRYAYSPTALDVLNFLDSHANEHEIETRKFVPGLVTCAAAREPLLQLLLVLPPSCRDLLPEGLLGIISDLSLSCAHCYPTRFEVAEYLLTEPIAVLPPMEGALLLKTLREEMSRISRIKRSG